VQTSTSVYDTNSLQIYFVTRIKNSVLMGANLLVYLFYDNNILLIIDKMDWLYIDIGAIVAVIVW
jgi:hypothetical protein